jgi:ribonuclease HI
LVFGVRTKEISGFEPATTNNRMELTAAINALRALVRSCDVMLHTDSQYLRRGITEWLPAWQARGWRKADGSPAENQDLWMALAEQKGRHRVEWHWVKGHRGNPLNERADQLATEARRRMLASEPAPRHDPPPSGRAPRRQCEPAELPQVDILARVCVLGVPGPGGYAALLFQDAEDAPSRVVSGGWPLTTSNAMELWAVIKGLQALRRRSRVTVHTGSKYVLEGATRWLASWERNGWRTRDGRPVKHREIWEELARVVGDHDVTWAPLPQGDDGANSDEAVRVARTEAERAREAAAD